MTEKKLWKFALIPLIINILAFILLVTLYVHYYDDIFLIITKPLGTLDIANPHNFLLHILDGLLWFLRGIFKVLFFLISFIIIFLVVLFLSSLVNAPFYEAMAEKILILKNKREDRPFKFNIFWGDLLHSLKIELFKIIFFFGVAALLFLLGWIPVVGPFFSFLGILFAAWVFAFGLCTFPMVINRDGFRDILTWAKSEKMTLIGFGLPSLIPFVGLLIIHFQVVGGTLLFIDRKLV